ncbi:MAG: M50 family metallopeptidase [Bryobacteraceae bacterium]
MNIALQVLKVVLWAEGLLLTAGSVNLLLPGFRGWDHLPAWRFGHAAIAALLGYMLALGFACMVAAWGLSAKASWGRNATIAASILNTIFTPIGTIPGVFGLLVLLSQTGQLLLAAEVEERKHRDVQKPVKPLALGYLVVVAAGVTAGLSVNELGRRAGVPAMPMWADMIAVPFGLAVAIALHEAGHMIAGWVVGFRFSSIAVGPLMITRRSDGWTAGIHKGLGFDGQSGVNIGSLNMLRLRRLIYAAGGPAASLVATAVFYLAAVQTVDTPWADSGDVFLTLSWLSLNGLIFSAWPVTLEGFETDGSTIADLVRMTPAGQRSLAMSACHLSASQPLRPRDWPSQWMQHMLAEPAGTRRFEDACFLTYCHHLDRDDPQAASEAIHKLSAAVEAALPEWNRRRYALELAHYEAIHEGNAKKAKRWLSFGAALTVERYVELRARAALLAAEGDPAAARTLIGSSREALSNAPRTGFTDLEHRMLDRLEHSLGSTASP